MAHKILALVWWNDIGRFTGEKSPEVRAFMLDADNYFLQPSSVNRPEGPRLQQTYLEPREPEPVKIRENW